MARPISNLRLFVGVYPPLACARAWLDAIAREPLPPGRDTRAEDVHLTLQFIGDVPARSLEAVRESVNRAAAGLARCELTPDRFELLPSTGPARFLALITDAPPDLLELQRRLAHRLARHVREPQRGTFQPHATLRRFSTPLPERWHLSVVPPPGRAAILDLRLMRSILAPDGARHHVIDQINLG